MKLYMPKRVSNITPLLNSIFLYVTIVTTKSLSYCRLDRRVLSTALAVLVGL